MDLNELAGNSTNGPNEVIYDRAEGKMAVYRERTFKERIADKIAYHTAEIEKLKAVHDTMTPDLEKFVEALNKVRL